MTKPTQIRLLVVDDHMVVRMGLVALLNQQKDFKVVSEAEDGAQAVEKYREHRPDVCLMDIRMPRLTGMQALAAIRAEFPDARVLMLTTYDGDSDIHGALTAGASGYLLKDVEAEELVLAIREVHRGGRYLPADVAQRLAERSGTPQLTPREIEVLELLAKGLSNKEIARVLDFTEFTAKAHVRNILDKLGVEDRTGAVTEALQRGILHLA
jgi:DNA-binding NarL/FixJ family response regulator